MCLEVLFIFYCFLRHPFARLYSTWREKTRKRMNTKPAEFVSEAKKFENLNATVPDGQEISFLAFLKYLANGRETRKNQLTGTYSRN